MFEGHNNLFIFNRSFFEFPYLCCTVVGTSEKEPPVRRKLHAHDVLAVILERVQRLKALWDSFFELKIVELPQIDISFIASSNNQTALADDYRVNLLVARPKPEVFWDKSNEESFFPLLILAGSVPFRLIGQIFIDLCIQVPNLVKDFDCAVF